MLEKGFDCSQNFTVQLKYLFQNVGLKGSRYSNQSSPPLLLRDNRVLEPTHYFEIHASLFPTSACRVIGLTTPPLVLKSALVVLKKKKKHVSVHKILCEFQKTLKCLTGCE